MFHLLTMLSAALAQSSPEDAASSKDITVHNPADILTETSGRWALIIGVDDYTNDDIQDLKFPAKDARDFAAQLVESGVYKERQVIVLTPDALDPNLQPTKVNILKHLKYLHQLGEQGELESIVFFFSGHGASSEVGKERVNYLFPVEADAELPEDTGIELARVQTDLQNIQAKQRLVILDACRNQVRVSKSLQPPSWTNPRYVDSEGTFILYGTALGGYSYEYDELNNGLLTYYLLKGMRQEADGWILQDGVVSAEELYGYVREQVKHESVARGHVQVPWRSGENSGDFPVVVVEQLGLATLVVTVLAQGALLVDGQDYGVRLPGNLVTLQHLAPGPHRVVFNGVEQTVMLEKGEVKELVVGRTAGATLTLRTENRQGRPIRSEVVFDDEIQSPERPLTIHTRPGDHVVRAGRVEQPLSLEDNQTLDLTVTLPYRGAQNLAFAGAALQVVGTAVAITSMGPGCRAVYNGVVPRGWAGANAAGWGVAGAGLALSVGGGLRWQEPQAWLWGGGAMAASGLGAMVGSRVVQGRLEGDTPGMGACVAVDSGENQFDTAFKLGIGGVALGGAALVVGGWRVRAVGIRVGLGMVEVGGEF
ncbi:MAG: caspase family protein [Alphaproteobacteria bacterium]|nr:caspase family protein [Alphaproteobacteria bacterium]